MTTIHTMEDLTRVLREHPEWREELRKQILTEQLLALPQRFDQHVERFDQHVERFDQHVERFDQHVERFDQHVERFDQHIERFDQHVEATDRRFDAVEKQIAENTRLIRVNGRHIGEIKGYFMETRAVDRADAIADQMRLEWNRTLTRQEIFALVRQAVRDGSAQGIPDNHIRSLRNADLIMEASDAGGRPCWIVAEISWTADERDAARAIRSAGYLARFTRTPVYAAVAALHVDKNAQHMLTRQPPRPFVPDPAEEPATQKAFHAPLDP